MVSISCMGRYLTRRGNTGLMARLMIAILLPACVVYQAQAARSPSAKRECATCHIMWLTEFKRGDVETLIPYDPTPIAESGKTDVVSTRRMCFSCHDGFMLDSRYMWKQETHTHPVGVKPSSKIKIPLVKGKELFPLNFDGKVYCGTCHSAHGVDWEQSKSAVFMRVNNEDGRLCNACHEEKAVGPKRGGHPVFKRLKQLPASLSKAGALFGNGDEVVCQSCHRPHGTADKKLLLVPNDRSQLCGACHTDNYPADSKAAGAMGTHPVNVRPQRARIPETLKQQGARFGRDGEVICQSCHRPHDAVAQTPLLVKANRQSVLCETCHQQQKSVADGKHDMRLVDAGSRNVQKDAVGEKGICSACHLAHKGTGPKMWARPVDKNSEPMAALCLSCHTAGGLAGKSLVGSHSHPVGAGLPYGRHPVDLPAFSREGVRQAGAGDEGLVTCASCHDPHRWDSNNPQARAKPGKRGSADNRFLRKVNDNDSQLCRSCHERQARISDSKHDLNIMAPRARNIRRQTLKQSGICGSCHLVHNAEGPFMWARNLPQGPDASSSVCLSCHGSDGLAKKKGIGSHGQSHPVNTAMKPLPVEVVDGRWISNLPRAPGQAELLPLPLYEDGHHTASNGRIGCGSCHDPHVWSADGDARPVKEIAKTEGGPDDSFLRIADQGQGALCLNCHLDKQALSKSRHNLTLVATGASAKGKQPAAATGVCTSCHIPHNAKGPYLWARDSGPGKAAIEVLCRECHRQGGAAGEKLTGRNNHPVGVKLSAGMTPHDLPLYSKDGRPVAHDGLMDCATCHDPHRWSPDDDTGGGDSTALKRAGDGRNSFLRVTSAPDSRLCLSCHREQRLVIGTDHDLSVSAPLAGNRNGQKVGESGICGQCHVPHGDSAGPVLWARFPGDKAANPAQMPCLSCHRSDEAAEGRFPRAFGHPQGARVWAQAARADAKGRPLSRLPVYDGAGEKAPVGMIACPSCHNPHQWDPTRKAKGPGRETEGDINTSFLRLSKTESFTCADCHGEDSLFRYKYFHSPSTHKATQLDR